jgi:ribonucleotide reductase alpha subunit
MNGKHKTINTNMSSGLIIRNMHDKNIIYKSNISDVSNGIDTIYSLLTNGETNQGTCFEIYDQVQNKVVWYGDSWSVQQEMEERGNKENNIYKFNSKRLFTY